MPIHKDLKRLVRRRMLKTGESYTAARAQLLGPKPTLSVRKRSTKPAAMSNTVHYAKLAGMSDAAVKKATGCDWKGWAGALDYAGASEWPHRTIAEFVREKFEIEDWWAQSVTVGYERIRGLRDIGQRRGGAYEATKSRTFPVAASELFKAFAEPRFRARWLRESGITVRKATANRSVRITWKDGTLVEVSLIAKGEAKSAVQIAHGKLPDKAAVTRAKEYWGERLDSLREHLARRAD